MSELETFRTEIRAWIEANCPPEMKTPIKSDDDTCWGGRNFVFQSEAQKLWMERCAEKGLTVPDWPKDYGGAGLSPAETKIFRQEMPSATSQYPGLHFVTQLKNKYNVSLNNTDAKSSNCSSFGNYLTIVI